MSGECLNLINDSIETEPSKECPIDSPLRRFLLMAVRINSLPIIGVYKLSNCAFEKDVKLRLSVSEEYPLLCYNIGS